MKPELINNFSLLKTFLDGLNDISGEPLTLYIDLEGNNLSRHGTLSLVTILIEPREKVYLIDVTKLGRDAFDTVGLDGRSVRNILEARDIIKVFFDIRNDSDALEISRRSVSTDSRSASSEIPIWDTRRRRNGRES